MLLLALDLSKPRKYIGEHISDIRFNMKMNNMDLSKYKKIAMCAGVCIGVTTLITENAYAISPEVEYIPIPKGYTYAQLIQDTTRHLLFPIPIVGDALKVICSVVDSTLGAL